MTDVNNELTLIHWFPVDDQGQEVELPEDVYFEGGGVRDVPATGDIVCFGPDDWEVVRRIWTTPVPKRHVPMPRQMCTLHIRKLDR